VFLARGRSESSEFHQQSVGEVAVGLAALGPLYTTGPATPPVKRGYSLDNLAPEEDDIVWNPLCANQFGFSLAARS
jgi:hypothetical protein